MTKIMFVCHGNICRSPMAEFIFKDLAERSGVLQNFSVSSSATSSEEIWGDIGNPVYPPAREELSKHGIICEGKRAVQMRKKDYDKYDLFVGMDSNNIRNMMKIFGSDPEEKVHKLLEFAGESEPVFERDKNNRRVLARRSYNLYSDVQKGENVVVEIPVQAGEKKFKYEQKVKLVNPKLYGRGYAIGDMGHTDYVLVADDIVAVEEK